MITFGLPGVVFVHLSFVHIFSQASGTQQGSFCPRGKQLTESRNRIWVISVSFNL